ncbi:MAG: hypothetical protein M9884_02550 [Rhodocyclaceae bacterium]|jgi:phage-related protein|nr:hypothetical protein [Rhodocyclaceae bacterium]
MTKPIEFLGDALDALRAFPVGVRVALFPEENGADERQGHRPGAQAL